MVWFLLFALLCVFDLDNAYVYCSIYQEFRHNTSVLRQIIHIAILCVVGGAASIPISFGITSSPVIVWLGNALGSLVSALFVIFIAERMGSKAYRDRMNKHRASRKVITIFEQGDDNQKVLKARIFINRHGLKVFSFLCPIFPGVLISTAAVYLLELDTKLYKRWMVAGVVFAS